MERKRLNNAMKIILPASMIALALVSAVSSCKKSGTNCFTNTGDIIVQSRPVSDFDTIIARENVDIIITQDTINSIEVEAGRNIINGITTVIENRQLMIGNKNICNWVRSYDKPLSVYVHVKNLRKIYYLSAGNITTTNYLNPYSFMLDVWGGCGSINLSLDVNTGYIYEHLGTADITIMGRIVYSSVVAGDFGPLDLRGVSTDFTYVTNSGTNDCFINSSKYLDATILAIGNIYYTGDPDTVRAHISGTGQLIEF
jgi:hypothetical protein